jgi:anti-sigma factor RsiW
MDCKETQELLSGYYDSELDLIRSLEVEKHLQQCVSCSDKLKTYGVLSNLTGGASLYHSAPAGLRDRVRAGLRKEEKETVRKFSTRNLRWLAYAASIAFVFFLGWMTGRFGPSPSMEESLNQDVLSNHVRSLMPGHLTDVESSNQHTVKPWFNGKVDFSPMVKDFSDRGFPLVGGRLDYLNHRTVPVLIYARNKHFINVFIWPSSGKTNTVPKATTLQGYHIFQWVSSGNTHYVVSDLNETELREFVKLLQTAG